MGLHCELVLILTSGPVVLIITIGPDVLILISVPEVLILSMVFLISWYRGPILYQNGVWKTLHFVRHVYVTNRFTDFGGFQNHVISEFLRFLKQIGKRSPIKNASIRIGSPSCALFCLPVSNRLNILMR